MNLYNIVWKNHLWREDLKALSRAHLLELGVTHVTEDGDVYVNDSLRKPSIIIGKHKYGQDRKYLAIHFIDKSTKKATIQKYKTKDGTVKKSPSWSYRVEMIPLARLMLAWFNGSIASNMDADHIDGNPMNNNLENLQPLSRKANLSKRALTHSQITKTYKQVQRMVESQ